MNNFWDIYDLKETINISNNKMIKIAYVKKENTIGMDIRQFYKKSGEWFHGKGLIVPINKWKEFQEVIGGVK